MKFFTLERYHAWHSHDNGSNDFKSAFEQYERHLEAMRSVLPATVLALAQLPGVDDGLVVTVRNDRDKRVLTLTLRCGDLQMGYFDLVLTYDGAAMSPDHERTLALVTRGTVDEGNHTADLYYHEVDAAENGGVEHRLLFHPGLWFAIRCQTVRWEKIPRPNRELPRLTDRYTDGPVVVT